MGWKKLILCLVWGAALIAWLGLIPLYATDPSVKMWAAGVTVVAIATEVAFWTTAALLGVTIWESRKTVWRFLTRPFRKQETR